ncbi:MAG: hypothetical protein ABIQ43_05575 [Sphingomonas sp.]
MTMSRNAKIYVTPFVALFLFMLSACTIGLVPAYDAGLADGLVDANKQALLLFSKDEDDTSKAGYAARADDYAKAISSFEELKYRAEARPVPPLSKRLAKTSFFRSVCPGDAESCLNASPSSLKAAIATLTQLRITHRNGQLNLATLALFKNQYVTAVQQALTVETALKR